MKTSKQIEEKIRKRTDGEVFSLEDILPKKHSKAQYFRTIKTLSKLQQERRVSRIRKGLYFKPCKVQFTDDLWMFDASRQEIAEYYQKKFKHKIYVTGTPLFNSMKLTEQVPATSVFAVENPPKDFKEDKLFFVKSKCPITEENKKYLQILDCIENIKHVPAKTSGEVADSLMQLHISHLSNKELLELVRYSKFYIPRTRAILAAMFATTGKKTLAEHLKQSYAPDTRFKIYFENSIVLENKEYYGIYNTYTK
ncbi:MAG: DUF6088 family protein [Lentimicrobiaceae bacterium]|nr:DUF6088 family protein [Lentimicrobiaceae bacterium]